MDLHKSVSETKWDIFPLDKLLPLETVYRIFKTEYLKIEQKGLFMDNHKFLRLREGYFALFVAAVERKISGVSYFIEFPRYGNDINFIEVPEYGEGKKWECDVKEYTDHSPNFIEFISKSIKKRIRQYFLIIALHKKVEVHEMNELEKTMKDTSTMLWLVSALDSNDYGYNLGKVIYLGNRKKPYIYDVDLSKILIYHEDDPMLVFHDKIHIK